MAAKPPKPPATLLKQSSHNSNDADSDNNGNKNNCNPSTSAAAASAVATPTTPTSTATHSASAEAYSKLGIQRYNSRENLLNNIANDYNYNENDTETTGNSLEGAVASAAAAARPACNCTNISIMHLFHEMKQEFPTIPDPIVAQCVNDNCHQRENCIQMLRNELALNPIPVQTYPAKVLQQHNINNQQQSNLQQQKQLQQWQKSPLQPAQTQTPTQPHPQPPQRHKNASAPKPATPLRPIRAAPTQPPSAATLQRVRADNKNSAVTPQTNCDSVELVQTSSNLSRDVHSVQLQCNNPSVSDSAQQACDMPVTATANANAPVECARSTDFISALNRIAANHPPSPAQVSVTGARTRPNTLNLHASQQQLQRQQLNKQLQQHLQQRCQLKQQQLASGVAEEPPQQKPIRRAPLPPIAPKPVFHNNISNNNNSCGNSPQSQSVGSYSTESAVTSPLSSCGESEVSANVGCSPTQAFALSHINNNRQNNNNNNNNNNSVGAISAAAPTYQPHPTSPLRSPIRHRSVINVQPEPPYARDFLPSAKISTVANPATGSSGGSTPTSQKSFTSVNLTLRQPTNAVPQSTIDISAGPVLSGNGSGLTYSSTSYNARHGFQQNFHITVTEEGGVFNASRIRPRNSGYYAGIEGANTPDGPAGGTGQITATSQQQQLQPATTILRSPTTQAAQNFASLSPPTTASSEDMCLPLENSVFIETIKRQKACRDKLASALRENKNKLGNVEEAVKMLTEPLNPGESERLDYEIERLRNDCQQALNEIENIRRYGQLSEVERLKQQQQQQQQQQAFPRQRPPRPPPPQQPQSPYQQYQPTEIDYPQQHNTPGSAVSTVGIGGGVGSAHNSAACTPNSPRLQQPPPQRADYVGQPPPYQQPSTDEEDYSDSNTDGGDDYEPLELWPCSMCTFLNHPQLNICEACECVRIIPGTIRIVPSAGGSPNAAAAAAAAATPQPPTPTAASSATAAAAAAALSAATPTAIAHGAGTASAGNSPTSAARTVAAE